MYIVVKCAHVLSVICFSSEYRFKVVPSPKVSCIDLLENDTGCVVWWVNFTCQFLIFSNKAFSSYAIFCVGKTPLTYCVVGF